MFKSNSLKTYHTLFIILLAMFGHQVMADTLAEQLQAIEKQYGGKIGVSVFNTGSQTRFNYRANERFPMGCTSKVIGVAAALSSSMANPDNLNKTIHYDNSAIKAWSPITSQNLNRGMTVKALCRAAISYSDNTAMNLLVKELGGLQAMNDFARLLGDNAFRQDNDWPEEAKSGGKDKRDSTTPLMMASNLYALLFKSQLDGKHQQLLKQWMLQNTTGDKRIRAGVPSGWKVADKTGTGMYYGTTNDIAVLYPGKCSPIVLAVYYTQNQKHAKPNNQVVVDVTKVVVKSLVAKDRCLQTVV